MLLRISLGMYFLYITDDNDIHDGDKDFFIKFLKKPIKCINI